MTDPIERFSAPAADEQTDEHRQAIAEISAGPRGALIGPFAPLSWSPPLLSHLQRAGAYLRFDSELSPAHFELLVLLVARFWDQQFEWGFHQPLALSAGLEPTLIDAVVQGRRPAELDGGLGAVWDLVTDLQHGHQVDDACYHRALSQLGQRAVLEVVAAVGYYTTLAMVMNVARTTPPAGAPRLPAAANGTV